MAVEKVADGGAPLNILHGVAAIATFLYGADPQGKRRVSKLLHESLPGQKLPTFKMGANICARPARLLAWIEEREGAAQAE
jgi:hypothetical protein